MIHRCAVSIDAETDCHTARRSLKAGDIIALCNSGAYTFSMAGSYNCLPRPAVVFVENGEAKLAAERQSFNDLIRGQYL